ncbi:MAG: hypothetical protein B1H11_07615 [Desulfobacteraceae bacterium 4484_190.1]|nr:MAG: hypothetical protein B1H11_07615 [Desulfobacteraceae bacterium 4484_190.1]
MNHITADQQAPRRSFASSIINRGGAALLALGIPLLTFSKDAFLRSAQNLTGLSDFGDFFSEGGLQILLRSLEREGNLTLLGRRGIKRDCIRLLSNNLRITNDLKRYPEIQDVPVRKPLFITGFPRTGTTFLHNLLACDPRARVPLMWELYLPSPPPTSKTRKNDPRIEVARKRVERLHKIAPHLALVHPLDPEGPDECFHLFKNSFMSPAFLLMANVGEYIEWLYAQDMMPAYRYYRRQLQLLQWRYPGEYWILKSPSHLPFLDSLLTIFPDARIIQTHRDPLKVVPSFCSLVLTGWQMSSDRIDVAQIGSQCVRTLKESVDRSIAIRKSTPKNQFFDLYYRNLVDDPIGTVRRIYQHFDLNFDAQMEKRMGRYLSKTQHIKGATHKYTLDSFGLNKRLVRQIFSGYIKNFSVKPE